MYRLRELEKNDMIDINKWRNDPELISFLGAPFRYINADVDMNWYNNYMQSRNSSIRCAIVDDNDEIVGLISLMAIDNVNRNAELHIMIGSKQNRGKGIGTFAVKEMINHAFNNLNLNRIELELLENNERALRLYEKVGFKVEGIKRDAVYKNGKYINMIFMGILKNEWIKTEC